MKIAHIGDVHWGLNYPGPTPEARFEDITRTMNWVAEKIIEENCELVLLAGDMFKDARVFLDRASLEIKAFADWLRKITNAGIPVVGISGTPSHDAVAAYKLIQEMRIPDVILALHPTVVQREGLSIACLPGFNRSSFVTQDEYRALPPHVIHQLMTEKITETCRELRGQCDGFTVLAAHLTYDLADTGFEDVLMQHEPVLTQEAAQYFDLVCLGHIHRPQQNGNVFYCGSPERLTFNDEQITPGFWIHESGKSRFIETPARRFQTVALNESDLEQIVNSGSIAPSFDPSDAVVRIRYTCSEDLAKRLDRRALEKMFYDLGAFYVTEIKADVRRQDISRDEDVTEALEPLEALNKWGCLHQIPDEELAILQAMTTELLEEVTI